MDPTGPVLGGPWRPFNGSNGVPVLEDVNGYLIRAAMWTLYTTKCDGFRLDAVKHVPSPFFGDSASAFNGYTGGIQAMFDWVHGYGTNFNSSFVENDDPRNSCFDTEAARNDAVLFGETPGATADLFGIHHERDAVVECADAQRARRVCGGRIRFGIGSAGHWSFRGQPGSAICAGP
jgi:hypothetical protein